MKLLPMWFKATMITALLLTVSVPFVLSNAVPQSIAQVTTCCQCYKKMRGNHDKTPFYMGVREIRDCQSYEGGYCAGQVPCP